MLPKKPLSLSETHKLPPALPTVESYKHYLEAVCNNATVALFIMDERQYCIYMNAAAERLTGYTLMEVQGRALHDVIHHTRPDGRPYPLCECPIDQAFPTNNQEQGEEVFVHKDGHFYTVAYTASPIREASGIVGTVIEVRDITQEKQHEAARREAAAALRQSEERFRQFSENVKDVFWITDLKTPRLLYVNSAYEDIWQRSRESLYQTYNWLETIHPDDRERVRRAVNSAFAEGYEIEYRIVRPDGSVRWIRDRGFALPELEGEPYRMAGIAEDITDRKQAEQEREQLLQQVEANFRQLETILNTMGEGLVVADAGGNILRFNRQALAMHGYERLEEVQHHFSQFPHLFDVRDTNGDVVPLEDWALARVLRGQSVSNYELTIRRRDTGKMFVGSYSGSLVYDADGQIMLAIVTMRDITLEKQVQAELARSEAKFRQMTDVLPQIFWTADPDGTIDYYSKHWENYTGLSHTDGSGWDRDGMMPPEDQQRTIAAWQRAVQAGPPLYECEHRIRNQAGEYRWHLNRAVPYRDEHRQIIKWFGLAIDIHEQKLAMEARSKALAREQAARKEAEQANRVKDEFLAVLSHELRSPLNPILGWTHLLQRGNLDQKRQTEALKTIERNAKLQAQLIEDLLDISRIMRGKLTLTSAAVSLPFVITAAVETVRLAAEAKQIETKLNLAAPVATVWGDAARLQQVIWNLLSNAVKFTPTGGRVEISLSPVSKHSSFVTHHSSSVSTDGQIASDKGQTTHDKERLTKDKELITDDKEQLTNYAQITVSDTGKGIRPEFLPYVFEYFRQEDGSTTRRFGGLGLGLAIARQIVELHGGIVTADSLGENQGATFTVQLPLMTSQAATVGEQADTSSLPRAASLSPLTGVQILMVDDDDDTREFQSFALEQSGAQVTAVASGIEALQVLKQFTPDVLVSDIGMAEMDGYMLIQQIRAHPSAVNKALPAIALTAYARDFDQQKALQAGFQVHLTKPISPGELVEAIANLMARDQ